MQEKMRLVRSIRRRLETGDISWCNACDALNIDRKQCLTWKKQFNAMKDAKNIKAKSSYNVRSSILKPIEKELLGFIFELGEQEMGVSTIMVMLKAASLSREFRDKSRKAQYHSTRRFVISHDVVHRMATNKSSKNPRETSSELIDFIQSIRPKLVQICRHQDFIINMDQTPIPFTYNSKRTLKLAGKKTIHVRRSTNGTKRATSAMTITASGKVLTPLVVFKDKPGGRIEKCEFPTYPSEIIYACRDNAWMDENVVLMWVNKVLKPYVLNAAEFIVLILLLDSYRCHMMASVVEKIQELGVEVEHIPGGAPVFVNRWM